MTKIKLAVIGCGNRSQIYTKLALQMPQKYEIIAAADFNSERVEKVKEISNNPKFRSFTSAEAILAEPKLADMMIIGTQDTEHFEPAVKAMEKGYDLLLEKPIATNLKDVLVLQKLAKKLNRKVLVCHVLRYTSFYQEVKKIVDSGILGDIININATEGVGPWHMAHSYVRGKWAVKKESSPMIISKCCHDLDIIFWLTGRKCLEVSSFGSLSFFKKENSPDGAPKRCTDGCPVEKSCFYNAMQYADKYKFPWLNIVYDGAKSASKKQIIEWLETSPYGRCVFQCDNDVVDQQVVGMLLEGGITSAFSLTAFNRGRTIEIYGTKGALKGNFNSDADSWGKGSVSEIVVIKHDSKKPIYYDIRPGYEGYDPHGGGDFGLINNLYDEMTISDENQVSESFSEVVHSHVAGFAAEQSRLTKKVINIKDFLLKK